MKWIKLYKKKISLFTFCVLFSNIVFTLSHAYSSLPMPQEHSEYISLSQFNLDSIIPEIIENHMKQNKRSEISDSLLFCYECIENNIDQVSVDVILKALPEILSFVVLQNRNMRGEKGVRPDGAGITSQVVTCGNPCNLNQVLKLLSTITSKIGSVNDPVCCDTILGILGNACECLGEDLSISCAIAELLDCCRGTFTSFENLEELICDKFEQTWTILDDLKDTVTECCAEIFEEFRETWTILEDVKETTCDKFEQTWTILADLNLDNSGVFTVLDDLKDTVTECCEDIFEDFRETWTILEDIKETTCDKFEQTWTILDEIEMKIDNITVTAEVDFGPIFTVLDNICVKIEDGFSGTFTAIEDLKEVMCDKFEQTWTILDDIKEITCDKFEQTWTILANLDLDNSGVFTVLDDLKLTLTECCADIFEDFRETWTILNEIEIKIDNIGTVTAEVDLSGVFTSINDLKETVTECCAEIFEDFRETWTILEDIKETTCDKFEQTWTVLDRISGALCNPIIINELGSSTLTISEPGLYKFKSSFEFSPGSAQPAIEITSDNVTLDLCGFNLSQGNSTSGVDGIRIQGGPSGTPRSNVCIQNGTINNFTRAGISVGTNAITPANTACDRICITDMTIFACEIRGLELLGNSSSEQITDAAITNCNINECCTSMSADFGIQAVNMKNSIFTNCQVSGSGVSSITFTPINISASNKCRFENVLVNCNTGDELVLVNIDSSENCTFIQCSCSDNIATNDLTGFVLTGDSSTTGNMIRNCIIQNNTTTNGPFIGFDVQENTVRNTLTSCISSNNTASGAVSTANSFGFNLDQVLDSSFISCRAMYNRASGDGTSNIAAGFNIGTTGGVGTGCKRCDFYENITLGNNGFNSARSFGIRAISGNGGNEDNAYIRNIAYRNGQTSAISTNQIIATAGPGTTSPGGVPFQSIRTETLGNLNGTTDVVSNIRAGD